LSWQRKINHVKKTIFLEYKEVFPTLALEFGVPGVGIPPGILASNRVPLPFNRVGDCLKVVSEDCFDMETKVD